MDARGGFCLGGQRGLGGHYDGGEAPFSFSYARRVVGEGQVAVEAYPPESCRVGWVGNAGSYRSKPAMNRACAPKDGLFGLHLGRYLGMTG